MRRRYLNVMLVSALLMASTGTFTSCKDYDDEIANLQEQVNQKASIEELRSEISSVESAINKAVADADKAIKEAQAAKAEAEEALAQVGENTPDGVTQEELEQMLKQAIADAEKKIQEELGKKASLEDVNAKIEALKAELLSDFVSDEELNALAAKVSQLSEEVIRLLGHRLTSMNLVPTQHINGIPAIIFTSLKYTPQVYTPIKGHAVTDYSDPLHPVMTTPADHSKRPVLDHTAVAGAKVRYLSSEKNEAYYQVSPNMGVRTQDLESLAFDCMTSKNITRAAENDLIKQNSPIEVTGFKIDKSLMTVTFKKNKEFLNDRIMSTGDAHPAPGQEKFWMASAKAAIAKENLDAEERKAYEAGTKTYVNSEYSRIEELVKVPYIANIRTNFSKPLTTDYFADEVQTDANGSFYVHYRDSICTYESLAGKDIDIYADYAEELDLKKYVTVCVSDEAEAWKDHAQHELFKNYKDYGLEFRFSLAAAPYITLGGPEGNTNKTDQQKFAKIDSPSNGIMTSKVYTIEGTSATAIGREPIVRISLVDTKNGDALVAQRYLKVKWTREIGVKEITIEFDPICYACGIQSRVTTQMMNELIYHQAKEGGMTHEEFKAIYTTFDENASEPYGTAKNVINTEGGVDSYNILWDLTTETMGNIWPGQKYKDFSKVVYYRNDSKSYPDLKITLKRRVNMPELGVWGHLGTYWKTTDPKYTIFNVNPIVYDTEESNPAWGELETNAADWKDENATCNIYTDLLNGFLNEEGTKPLFAEDAVWYDCGKVKEDFYKKPYETIRFVFDDTRINNYTYQYYNRSAMKYEPKKATVQNRLETIDGTSYYVSILWINGEVAAKIINERKNFLNAAEQTYNIRLEEENAIHAPRTGEKPTEAAKALVGADVPVRMEAVLCDAVGKDWNVKTVKAYEAFIIEPLTMSDPTLAPFTDAQEGGSRISIEGKFTYKAWNNSTVANTAGLPKALWEFYEANEGEWPYLDLATGELDPSRLKTNLKLVDGNIEPVEGYQDGALPKNVKIIRTTSGGKDELVYYNYSGTPVNKEYIIYIPVTFTYKWKTFVYNVAVTVKPNPGTPSV